MTHAATTQTISTYVEKLKAGGKFFNPTPFSSFPKKEGVFPPLPAVYSGTVILDGNAAPNGAQVLAVVGDYVSEPVFVSAGNYNDLNVGPPYGTYQGMTTAFYVDGFKAAQTRAFSAGDSVVVNLTVTTPPPP